MGLVETFERITDAAAKEIVTTARTMDKAIGDRPFGAKLLPERAQVRRYTMIRDDPAAWKQIISEHGPGPAVEYAKRMEKMLARYPDEDKSQMAQMMGRMTAEPPEVPMGGEAGVQPAPQPAPLQSFSRGGLVTKPTLAVVGEEGPEMIVPLGQSGPEPYVPERPVRPDAPGPKTWAIEDLVGPPPDWLRQAYQNLEQVQQNRQRMMEDLDKRLRPLTPKRILDESTGRASATHNPELGPLSQPHQETYGPVVPHPGDYPENDKELLPSGLTRGQEWYLAYNAWLRASGISST